MSNWLESSAYDAWKTTPPEDDESPIKCECCGDDIYYNEHCYKIENIFICEYCAKDTKYAGSYFDGVCECCEEKIEEDQEYIEVDGKYYHAECFTEYSHIVLDSDFDEGWV